MARFDVHAALGNRGLVLDCQSNDLRHLNTRFIVPLQLPERAPVEGYRLNPRFKVNGADHVMVTQFAAALPVRLLGPVVASLADEDYRITNALDTLTTGF